MEGLQADQGAAPQLGQAIDQPAPVDPHQGRHVGDGADAEQVERNLQAIGPAQALAKARGQHVGQANSGQAPIGGVRRGSLGMEQGQVGRQGIWNRVVVGEDRLDAEGLGPLQGLEGRDAVVHRHQQGHTLLGQALDHGGVQAIAVIHAAGDGGDGPGSQSLEHTHQQGRAGHAVGVVIPANCYLLALPTGPFEPGHGLGQIGEVATGGRSGGRIEQGPDLLWVGEAPSPQNRQ